MVLSRPLSEGEKLNLTGDSNTVSVISLQSENLYIYKPKEKHNTMD